MILISNKHIQTVTANSYFRNRDKVEKSLGTAFFHLLFCPKDRSFLKVTINGNKYHRSYLNLSMLKIAIKTLIINSI